MVEIPGKTLVDHFLPPYKPLVALDVDNPKTLAVGGFGATYAGWRRQQQLAMTTARQIILEVGELFATRFHRQYGGLVTSYRCDDAEAVLVCMGGISGTVREVVNEMRNEGSRVGFLKVRFFRPFPKIEVKEALSLSRAIAVIDRECSYGYEGALCSDLKAALYGLTGQPPIINFIAGLGGADIRPGDVRQMLHKTLAAARAGKADSELEFVGAEV
jgi:pyruvate ferredoxin oxidoreductase alpha subunit